jgi:hypothetical protein
MRTNLAERLGGFDAINENGFDKVEIAALHMSPIAQSEHRDSTEKCPLSGAKRTLTALVRFKI